VDQTAEAANEDWVFPGRKRSGVGFAPWERIPRGSGCTGVRSFKRMWRRAE